MHIPRCLAAILLFTAASCEVAYATNASFPFDRELLLEAAPMRPAKRKPAITVAPNGQAVIDLWCKSVYAQVDVSSDALKITPGELPQSLPSMMAPGQCTPERMRADETVLDALAQVSAWRRQGDAVILSGPTTLRFFLSTH